MFKYNIKGHQIIKKHCKSDKIKLLPRIYFNKNEIINGVKLLNNKRTQYLNRYEYINSDLGLVF